MPDDEPYYLDLEMVDDVLVVHLIGTEVKHPKQVEELSQELSEFVVQEGYKRILLDLSRIGYLSSTAFAILIKFAREVGAAGGRLKLYGIQAGVLVGLRIIGLNQIVEIYDDERAAIEAFARETQPGPA